MANIKFWLIRILDKALERTLIHPILATSSFFSSNGHYRHDRNQHDQYSQKLLARIMKNRQKLPTVSAVYRVKNAAPFLESAVSSVAPFVSEVIIIDNNSHDETTSIAKKLQQNFAGFCEIKLFSYPQPLAQAGDGYAGTIEKNPEQSLATFYNFCFGKATQDYVMKADAHCIYQPARLLELQDKLKRQPDILYFRGIELLGKKLSIEPYLFKRSLSFSYIDSTQYELLRFNNKALKKAVTLKPVFIHIKRAMYSEAVFKNTAATKHLYR